MEMISDAFREIGANKSFKVKYILFFYRFLHYFHGKGIIFKVLLFPLFLIYKVQVEWILGIEIPWSVKIGYPLRLYHGTGLVLHPATVMGKNCVMRHCTTVGSKREKDDVPVFGDNVDIGSNSVILGRINIGDNSIIGAGSVVVDDVPPNSIVAGNPARVIRSR